MTARRLALVLVLVCLAACRVARPSELSRDEAWLVAVKSAGIPESMPWYTHFAEHTWVDVKCGSEDAWKRAEVLGASSGARWTTISATTARADVRWREEAVRVQRVIAGADARRIAERLPAAVEAVAARYGGGGYDAWPGPNSNTFVRDLAREVPELAFVFDHNAVGKDYAYVDAGLTPSRTGVQLDTWPFGVALGASEGVEVHLLQLTFGVRVWPPRLLLPFLPSIPWDAAPDGPPAMAERPSGAQHVIEMPDEDDSQTAHSTMIVPCLPELADGDLVLVSTTSGSRWIAIRVARRAPTELAPRGGITAAIVTRAAERLELEQHLDFDEAGRATIGPLAAGDLRVTIDVERLADGRTKGRITAETGGD